MVYLGGGEYHWHIGYFFVQPDTWFNSANDCTGLLQKQIGKILSNFAEISFLVKIGISTGLESSCTAVTKLLEGVVQWKYINTKNNNKSTGSRTR